MPLPPASKELSSLSSPPSPLSLTVGMLGCGNMGKALARAWVKRGVVRPERLLISARTTAQATAEELGAQAVSPQELLLTADVVVLGFKPQQLPQLAPLWAERAPSPPASSPQHPFAEPSFSSSTSQLHPRLFVSLLAGVSCEALPVAPLSHQTCLGRTPSDALVRVMPNIPVEVSQGATLAYSPAPLTHAHSEAIEALFGAVGLLEWLSDEAQFHAGTAISGCGPAYLWVMIEALADAGVAQGLSRAVAQRLAAQTMLGSGAMALEAHPALLKDRVTSPGGVTIEGVRALERAGVRSALIEAVACATSRSQALDQASRTP